MRGEQWNKEDSSCNKRWSEISNNNARYEEDRTKTVQICVLSSNLLLGPHFSDYVQQLSIQRLNS
jgi:hypothetical protein